MLNYQPTYDADTRTWHGPVTRSVFNPEASMGQIMFEALSRSPDLVMQIDMDTGRSMTYAEFKTRMIRFAQNLTTIGVRKGDVVALMNANSENLAPLVCALVTIGAPLNPIAPSFKLDDVADMLQLTGPKWVFCDANNYETIRSALKRVMPTENLPIYVFEDTRDDVLHAEDLLKKTGQEDSFMPQYLGDSRQTLLSITCSSGTTGGHKGISHSHASGLLFNTLLPYSPTPTVQFNFSPIYWMSGLSSLICVFNNGGIRLFTRKGFSEELFFEAVEKYHTNAVLMLATHANIILSHPRTKTIDFRSVTSWSMAGTFFPDALRAKLDALLPNGKTVNIYGASEIGGISMDFFKRKQNTIGTVMPNVSVRVIDENGNRMGVGEHGELLMKPLIPFLGYYGNAEATMAEVDSEGFFRSGDIGYVDEEGFVYLIDRRRDIFKYLVYNVIPWELEELILKIDGVQEVAVVSVPDIVQVTDLPAAAIVKTPNSELDVRTVHSIIDSQVPDHKRLRGGVHFFPKLPKTDNGKVMRRKVAEIVERMNADQAQKVAA